MGQESLAGALYDRIQEAHDEAVAVAGCDWWWLTVDLGMEMRQKGDDLRGFSFCQKVNGWLLCLRVVRDGVPEVVYINRVDPSACVRKLRYKWDTGTLTFFADRYA